MRKIFAVLAVLPIAATAHAGDSNLKSQLETGVNVTQSFAERILAAQKFEAEKRTDYYVDIFDGHDFLLIPGAVRNELRMKFKKGKENGVMQASLRDSEITHRCAAGLELTVKKKSVGSLELGKEDTEWLKDEVSGQLTAISGDDRAAVKTSVQKLGDFLRSSGLPNLRRLERVPSGDRWVFAASHVSKKTKWKRKINEGHGAVTVSVTEADDYSGDDYVQTKYEVEFQADDDMTARELGDSACRYLERLEPSGNDTDPSRKTTQEFTLAKLRKFKRDLGL